MHFVMIYHNVLKISIFSVIYCCSSCVFCGFCCNLGVLIVYLGLCSGIILRKTNILQIFVKSYYIRGGVSLSS